MTGQVCCILKHKVSKFWKMSQAQLEKIICNRMISKYH